MNQKEEVINFMKTIEGRTPILLIANASKIFKRIYKGKLFNINNQADFDLVYNFAISKVPKVIVLDQVSNLYNDEKILKLVEESNLKLILLADQDNISQVLVSRCKASLKLPDLSIKECLFIDKFTAYQQIQDMDNSEIPKYLSENCPLLLADLRDTAKMRYKDRLIEIKAGLEALND